MSALPWDTEIISPFRDSIRTARKSGHPGPVRCLTASASAASEEPKAMSESAACAC